MIFRLLLVFISFGAFAQNKAIQKADSLRWCGFFREELQLREAGKSSKAFDLRLAEANVFLEDEEPEKAVKIFKTLKPNTTLERFWLSKSLAGYYKQIDDFETALSLLNSVSVPPNSLMSAVLKVDRGKIYASKNEQLLAIKELESAIKEFGKSRNENHFMNGIALSDLAFAYDEVGIRNKTVDYSERAVRLFVNYYPQDFWMVSLTHNNLVFYVIEYGDEKVAGEVVRSYRKYMQEFLSAKHKYRMPQKFSDFGAEGLYRLSLLRYYSFINDSPNILKSIKELEQFYVRAPKDWSKDNLNILSQGYEEVQYSFRQQKKFKEALYYSAFIDKVQQAPYNNMKKHAAYALTYYDSNNNPEALKHVNLCLREYRFPKGSRSLQTLMVLKAELLSRLGKSKEAKRVLREIYDEVLGKTVSYSEINPDFYPQHTNKIFMNLLIHSGMVYQNIYEQDGNKQEDYKTAKHFYFLAGRFFEKYYHTGLYNNSLGELLDEIEDGLFYRADKLSQDQIITYSNLIERISNAHVWRRFSSKYIQNLNLPTDKLKRMNELQLQRSLLSKSYELELKNHKKIAEIDGELNEIGGKLSKNFPEYSALSSSEFDFKTFQKKIGKEEVIIKFSFGLNNIYAHIISNQGVRLLELGSVESIKELVNTYNNRIKSIRNDYKQIQKELKAILIKPLGLGNIKRLTLISEGFLSSVPIETLLEKPIPVAYGLSLKNLNLDTKNSRTYFKNLVGFVPSYTSVGEEHSFGELKYSLEELKKIEKQIGRTTVYEGKKADKTTFLQSLGKYKVHHLSMHSEMDKEDYQESSLLFSKAERVYFHDLYALNFPSEMVVLSACNTGLGKYLNGEGVMSLARALNYAGVKSTVTSLWQIPDKESSELMNLFYKFLSDGLPKDQALIQAKIAFQKNYPMKSHPYYWAGFVLTGDVSPLELNKSPLWIVLTILLVLGIVFYFIRKRFLR